MIQIDLWMFQCLWGGVFNQCPCLWKNYMLAYLRNSCLFSGFGHSPSLCGLPWPLVMSLLLNTVSKVLSCSSFFASNSVTLWTNLAFSFLKFTNCVWILCRSLWAVCSRECNSAASLPKFAVFVLSCNFQLDTQSLPTLIWCLSGSGVSSSKHHLQG